MFQLPPTRNCKPSPEASQPQAAGSQPLGIPLGAPDPSPATMALQLACDLTAAGTGAIGHIGALRILVRNSEELGNSY